MFAPKRRKLDEQTQVQFKERVKTGRENKKIAQHVCYFVVTLDALFQVLSLTPFQIVKIVSRVCPQLDEQKEIEYNPHTIQYAPYLDSAKR